MPYSLSIRTGNLSNDRISSGKSPKVKQIKRSNLILICLMLFAFAGYAVASFVPCSYDPDWGEYRYDPFSIAAVIAIAAVFGFAKLGISPGFSLIRIDKSALVIA